MNHANNLFNILKTLGIIDAPVSDAERAISIKALGLALGDPELALGKYQPQALSPALQNLGNPQFGQPQYFAPQSLSLNQSFFPKGAKPGNAELEKQYAKLKNDVLASAGNADLVWLAVEKQGTSLAIHAKYPDISVADAVRLATAFSVCLEKNGAGGEFRLLGASVSGIQNYLYDIISKNAAKLLKGRSFYVQLLTDSLVEKLINDLGLSPLNVIYSSGGGCYVLAPSTKDTLDAFDKFAEEATVMLYREHKSLLFVDFAKSVSFGASDNLLTSIWDDLLFSLNRARFRRLSKNKDIVADFLGFTEYGGATEKDPITNIEFAANDPRETLADGVTVVHKRTWEQIELGKILRETKNIASFKIQAITADLSFVDPFGLEHHFFKNDIGSPGIQTKSVKTLNKPEGALPTILYGGNTFPYFEKDEVFDGDRYRAGDPKPYDYLAQGKDFDRLGVLRMDVDNLGLLFSEEISKCNYPQNFARYAAVSRSLDWFFKGYLNTYWKKYEDSTVIIYSGGDDLFIVGRWNEVLSFGKDIREEFKTWVCQNPHLTISGGIAIVTGKYPLMQAAKNAKEAEETAKKYPEGKKQKNAFCLLGKALGWDVEMPIVQELKDEIFDFLKSEQLSSSIITKISAHAVARETQAIKNATQRWRWTMAWDLSRYRDSRAVKTTGAKEYVERVMKDSFGNTHKGRKINSHYHYLDLLFVAVRWAELERRTHGL